MADVKQEAKGKLDINSFKIDPKKATAEDIQKALELLSKQKFTDARIKAGELKGSTSKKVSEMSPEEKKKYQDYNRRLTAKNAIIMKKAREAGITATDKEVDDYLKTHSAK